MTITLYSNTSDKIKIDKNLTQYIQLTGTLKNETSVIDPVILLEGDLSSYKICNYCYIAEFKRFYFINNIKSIRNGLFEISCHVDVLSTYKASIRQNKAIIRRQQDLWNLYLNDGSFRVYQNPIVMTKEFPSGFSTQEFVLAVAGA